MAVSKMPCGVSCASFEGPPRQSKAGFECYLQYFRRVHRLHRHEGYIFPEGLLGGSREPFGNHLRGLGVSSGVPGSLLVLSWRLLGVSQGGPWDVFGERPHCVFLYLVAICGIFYLDILAYPGEIVFLIIFVRDWCFCSIQKKPRFPFHALTGSGGGPF